VSREISSQHTIHCRPRVFWQNKTAR